jgi:hypothetical protein
MYITGISVSQIAIITQKTEETVNEIVKQHEKK